MKPVLCFGEALIDFHAQAALDAQAPPVFVPHAGGAPANVAVGVARLGGHAAFVGMLARDMFGDLLLAQLRAAGVDTSHVARTAAAPTALAFVAHAADGERSFSFYRPPAADLLFREVHFDQAMFRGAAAFHACSNSLTEEAIAHVTVQGMRRARAAEALVSFDMNLRPALWPRGGDPTPQLWRALAEADLVKLSAEELDFLAAPAGGEAVVFARLWQGTAQFIVVTDGARGLRWYTRNRHGELPAFSVSAVDTTGAGDAFVAGLLYQLCGAGARAPALTGFAEADTRRDDALRFAAACGALAVTRAGSFSAMPTRQAVHTFLQQNA
jgi:fructokinase